MLNIIPYEIALIQIRKPWDVNGGGQKAPLKTGMKQEVRL